MNLSGLFQYGTNHTNTANQAGAPGSGAVSQGNSVGQSASGLTPGQTLQGEVVGRNGSEVQILVDNEVMITARLDGNIHVPMGQSMTFEVKNHGGAQIALRPLFENMAQDANVLKALEAARLPATEDLMRMVSEMMRQGMSIDRNSLLDMSRLLSANGGARPETVVQMKNFRLPITPENIMQFENYQRYEHQLLGSVKDILAELPQAYQFLLDSGNGKGAVDFYTQVLQLFTEEGLPAAQGESLAGGQSVFADIHDSSTANGETALPAGAGHPQEALAQTETKMAAELHNLLDSAIIQEAESAQPALAKDNLLGMLEPGERNQLVNLLGRLGFSEGQLAQIQDGSMSPKQFLQELQQLLQTQANGADRAALQQLFGSKAYHQILQREIWNQWTLQPRDVGSRQKVEEFYGRLREQAARLTEALGQTARETPLAKNLTMMQNNLDFMNQVNQLFQYIQLPLKMSGGDAHGDLYVYTNRRATAKEDGSVSALLHLDMEHLGTMDIHVLMKDKNVNTKFYLANEGIIDFIGENIHILNERLAKRGYALQAEMLPAASGQEHGNVMETITAREKKATLLAQYSFDVRA
ncbi:MAG: flagellar hook-length control protein FliK [Kineothrix sp.]